MDGYNIDFAAAGPAADKLSNILEGLAKEIKSLDKVEEDMLSDANWKGPNKSTFQAEFAEYRAAIAGLYNNGVEHLETLQKILSTYASAEQ